MTSPRSPAASSAAASPTTPTSDRPPGCEGSPTAAKCSSVRSASVTSPAGPTAWTGARTAAARACRPCSARSCAARAATPQGRPTYPPCDTIFGEPHTVTGGEPPGQGRLAQRKSVSLTRRRSGVRAPQRPPSRTCSGQVSHNVYLVSAGVVLAASFSLVGPEEEARHLTPLPLQVRPRP
jgi:hypothetical protein